MHARAALPLLLLCTLPARGEDASLGPGACSRMRTEGAQCFTGSRPGRCGRTTCTQELDSSADGELREYECYVCMDLAQYAHDRQEHCLERNYRLSVELLGAGGLMTLAWLRWRRRTRGPPDSTP